MQYFLWFSVSCCFTRFSEVFGLFFWWRQSAAGRSPKCASCQGGWGERSCPRSATAIHSVAADRTANLPIGRRTLKPLCYCSVVFGWFRVLVWYTEIHIRIHFIYKLFSECWRGGPYDDKWASFSCTCPNLWPKLLAALLFYNLIFLNNFLPGYAKNAYNQLGFSNVTWTTANLPRQMLTTKLFTMHLAMIGFWKLWVVWRSIFLTC